MANAGTQHAGLAANALLECILSELKLRELSFSEDEKTRTSSPSASTRSGRSSSVSSPQLQPSSLRLDSEKIQLPLAELLPVEAGPAGPKVSWKVQNPNAKFKASCGFPLVSHQLSNHILEDFRVIFSAGTVWASQNKGKKQQTPSKASSKFGSLQLKFLGDEAVGDLQLFFHIGSYKLGPFRTYPERSVSELCELPVDWRRLVEKADMSLTIGVEVVL